MIITTFYKFDCKNYNNICLLININQKYANYYNKYSLHINIKIIIIINMVIDNNNKKNKFNDIRLG